MTVADTARGPATDRRGPRRVLVTLCITQITSWGVLYYAFPVLSGQISADTGWPVPTLAAAFSAGLVVSALLGIVVGRWLDRHGPRWLMTLGSVVAAVAVVGLAWAPTIGWFAAAWVAAGAAMSAVLYPPAFAALTRWYGPAAGRRPHHPHPGRGAGQHHLRPDHRRPRRPAGLARHLPGAGRGPGGGHRPGASPRLEPDVAAGPTVTQERHRPDRVLRSRSFLALVAAFALAACASYAVVVNLVPLLDQRGVTARGRSGCAWVSAGPVRYWVGSATAGCRRWLGCSSSDLPDPGRGRGHDRVAGGRSPGWRR